MRTEPGPIIGELSITTTDGTVLSAPNDVRLAWLWAEHEYGDVWQLMRFGDQCATVADALAELRRAYSV